jgi:hypothetical protein
MNLKNGSKDATTTGQGAKNMSTSTIVKPSLAELLPIYEKLLPRRKIIELAKASEVTLYWRLLTPLVMVWGFIYQRLNRDHSCDGFVSHLHTGGADHLAADDGKSEPLSQRLKSENSSAYCQARKRLPLSILTGCLSAVSQEMVKWLPPTETASPSGLWHGLPVRLLDGTTYRLRPWAEVLTDYGQASNQYGSSYWVTVRSVAAFCLYSQSVVAYSEGRDTISEVAMTKTVMAADPIKTALYLGDQGFGIYRTAQVAHHEQKEVLLRLPPSRCRALQKRHQPSLRYLKPGEQRTVVWSPSTRDQIDLDLPAPGIPGRLIYARIEKAGFKPMDIYLFTTLLDETQFPASEIVALYGQRLRVEIDYRQVKTTLEMDQFEVKTSDMFRKELAAGLLTYNLICALMVKAAQIGHLLPSQLSFAQCWRRIRDTLFQGVPAHVYQQGDIQGYLLQRLAQCQLPHQPHKVRHEPRKVRRKPAVFPPLKGDRNIARQKIIDHFAQLANS